MRSRRILAALLMVVAVAGAALARQAGGDTRRRTIAVTYPDKGRIRVVLAGTTRTPKFNGGAEVRRLRGLTQVEIELDDMAPAYLLGGDYTTYVMWAITPQGQTDNLGEFRLSGSRSKLRATTNHETFALLVTAEPHYAVTKPSKLVVLENVPPKDPAVVVQTTDVFFTGDSGKYYTSGDLSDVVQKDWDKQPLELLGARRAVEVARLANAERFAKNAFNEAIDSFSKAEAAWQVLDRENTALYGREAIRHAVLAKELAEQREKQFLENEDRKRTAALIAEADRKNQEFLDEIESLKGDVMVERKGRERAEEEAERLHEEVARLRVQNEMYRSQIEQVSSQVRELEQKVTQIETQRQAEQAATQRQTSYQALGEMLRPLANVQTDSRGFKIVLPDSYFDQLKATLRPTASAKLNPIAAVLLAHPHVEFVIEGYTDDKLAPEVGLQLSEDRSRTVGEFLTAAGVQSNRFRVTGYGSANPIASNKTLKGRATNRRVEIIFLRP